MAPKLSMVFELFRFPEFSIVPWFLITPELFIVPSFCMLADSATSSVAELMASEPDSEIARVPSVIMHVELAEFQVAVISCSDSAKHEALLAITILPVTGFGVVVGGAGCAVIVTERVDILLVLSVALIVIV